MQRLLSIAAGAARRARLRAAAHAALQGARLRTRMGRAGAGTRRRQGQRLRRHHRLAGSASHRGPAEPDRRARATPIWWSAPAPSSRSAGCRLLIQQSGNSEDPAGQAGQLRGRRLRAASSRCRRGSTAPTATCTRRAIRTSRPIRATSRSSPSRWRDAWPNSIRPTRRATRRGWRDFTARWKAAIARWEQQAAPLRGTPIVVAAQGLHLPGALARPEGGGRARAQARRRADQRAPERGAGRPASASRRR